MARDSADAAIAATEDHVKEPDIGKKTVGRRIDEQEEMKMRQFLMETDLRCAYIVGGDTPFLVVPGLMFTRCGPSHPTSVVGVN